MPIAKSIHFSRIIILGLYSNQAQVLPSTTKRNKWFLQGMGYGVVRASIVGGAGGFIMY